MKLHNNKIDSDKHFPQMFGHTTTDHESFFCAHIGPSMNPTLTDQDLLEIEPFHKQSPQRGDVILFRPPEHDHYVVHRITRITANGIQTRGDNNYNIDTDLLTKGNIYGRVIAAHRGKSFRNIANGFWGRWTGRYCHARRLLLNQAVKYLGPVYRSLCSDGFLHWLIPYRVQPQVAYFRTDHNSSHKLLLGKLVIGSYDDDLQKWQVRRPYRPFINETSLPKPR